MATAGVGDDPEADYPGLPAHDDGRDGAAHRVEQAEPAGFFRKLPERLLRLYGTVCRGKIKGKNMIEITDEIASENTEIYNLKDIHPIKAPIYYNVENDYYFKDENNNFIRETATVLRGDQSVIENKYYTIEGLIPLNKIPFIPNTYYYEENGEYKLAQTLDTSKTYYKYPGAFVYNDSNNI